jgi:DNA-binding NarL/FixJ family response regulator
LSREGSAEVVAAVPELALILPRFRELQPQVVILNLCLPGREGLEEARILREHHPDVKVLMIGLTELESDFVACVESGASGCIRQDGSLSELRDKVEALAAGEARCSPREAAILFSHVATRARERQGECLLHLTSRQLEIIALIEAGASNKEISARLGVAIQTVKNHVHNVLDKLKLDCRKDLARFARETGLEQTIARRAY